MLSRRAVVLALASGSGCGLVRTAHAGRPQFEGCSLIGGDPVIFGLGSRGIGGTDANRDQPIFTSGDRETDHRLGRALLRLANVFEVRPGCFFFDDWDNPNAYAKSVAMVTGTEGTVVIGQRLFRETMAENPDGIAILAICAHEFGHVAQFRGMAASLQAASSTKKLVELHADFLAGFYLGLRQADYPSLRLWSAGALIHKLGDNEYTNPNHHGTAEERTAAIEEGYRLGRGKAPSFAQAMRLGGEFVRKSF